MPENESPAAQGIFWGLRAEEFLAGASHQISLMKWMNIVEPIGPEARGIHASAS